MILAAQVPSADQLSAYWPYIIMAINGLIAGWLAHLILGGGGLLPNLVTGILGAILGGFLQKSGFLPLPVSITNVTNLVPYGTQILISTIGALIVTLLARLVSR